MTSSLAEALAQLQTKLPEIRKSAQADVEGKTKEGKHFSYSYMYADLPGISAAIMPLLGELGLAFMAKPTFIARPDGKHEFVLAYSLMHISGEREDGEYPLPQSGTPQAIGSAITYGRRYCLCSVTGVAPEQDDDDGVAAGAKDAPKTAQRRSRTPPTRQPEETPAEQSPRRTAQRAAPAPPLPDEDGYPNRVPNLRTERQSTLIHTLFTNIDWGDRDAKLRAVRAIIGRQVGSTKELTTSEASKLIDELEPVAKADDSQGAMLELLNQVEQKAIEGEQGELVEGEE